VESNNNKRVLSNKNDSIANLNSSPEFTENEMQVAIGAKKDNFDFFGVGIAEIQSIPTMNVLIVIGLAAAFGSFFSNFPKLFLKIRKAQKDW